ncbi:hypothetical protein SAMN05444487_12020 [Marininema mesophilum]|uniref:Uncharacterized protein n=1 Tax=Marininema mesophilum TaxID=1048340 RepID=A0A1H3C6C8_9BACL|nr:hypothetical protein [Marininema mesophilum]SDX49448.1 hypothetical protein SAMN05444487_12020 [Marininema mesophilum]
MQKLRRVLPFAAAFALVVTVSTSAAFASDGNDATKADKSLPTKHAVKAPSNSTPAKSGSKKPVAIAKDKNGNVTIKHDKSHTGTSVKPVSKKAVDITKDKNGNATIKKSDRNHTGTPAKPVKPTKPAKPAKPGSKKAVDITKDKNGNAIIKKSDRNHTGTTLKPVSK